MDELEARISSELSERMRKQDWVANAQALFLLIVVCVLIGVRLAYGP
jgi:hypothetical protein